MLVEDRCVAVVVLEGFDDVDEIFESVLVNFFEVEVVLGSLVLGGAKQEHPLDTREDGYWET